MAAKSTRHGEIRVFRGPKIGLIAGVVAILPFAARAQVNIDAGKTAAEIYASDCATCHKSPRGLAAGKNSLMLSSFLREHYTASGDQAKALAAYVLGAGGAEPAPKQKPETEHAREEPREPKTGEPKSAESKSAESRSAEARTGEAKPGQPKTARSARAAAKPDDKRAREEEATREQHPAPAAAEDHASQTASREEKREPEETAPAAHEAAPAPVSAAPAPPPQQASRETPGAAPSPPPTVAASTPPKDGAHSGLPSLELGSSLEAKPPAENQTRAAVSAPRDNIPD